MDPSGEGVAPAVANALSAATEILTQAGYSVTEVEPPFIEDADQTIQRFYETETTGLTETLALISQDAGNILKSALGHGTPNAQTYRDAIADRHQIAVAWSELMDHYPLILGPVSTMEAFKVGYDTVRCRRDASPNSFISSNGAMQPAWIAKYRAANIY